jgi:hypothetical protein
VTACRRVLVFLDGFWFIVFFGWGGNNCNPIFFGFSGTILSDIVKNGKVIQILPRGSITKYNLQGPGHVLGVLQDSNPVIHFQLFGHYSRLIIASAYITDRPCPTCCDSAQTAIHRFWLACRQRVKGFVRGVAPLSAANAV